MTKFAHPDADLEAAIDRILEELRFKDQQISEAKQALTREDRVQNLGLAAGVRALVTLLREAEAKTAELEKELYNMIHKRDKR